MRKLLDIIICSIFIVGNMFAQTSVDRYTVSSAGAETFDGSGNSYMYNIGGVIVNTTSTGSGINLTQGFEQGDYMISDILIFNPPNAFSPDGDGVNDTWIIPLLIEDINIVIFNRWGDEINRIEKYNNIDNVWNGTYKNSGEQVTNGTYFYIAETEDASRKFSGWIQVVR